MRALVALAAILWVAPARAAGNPDFDAVPWASLGCDIDEPAGDESPSGTDLVGDATFPAAYFAHDGSYLYFRYRVNGDPSGPNGFSQNAWVALMQVPAGNPFQYQYELALNGSMSDDDFGNTGSARGDNIEIWANTVASDISFTPLFNDPAETRIFAQKHDFSSGATVNTTPLARFLLTGDGSNFGGNADYFVDFAFPVPVLIAKGVIPSAAQLASSLFFPATSANANNYNKDHLPCTFLPPATLDIQKTAAPTVLPVNAVTPVLYTIVVTNTSTAAAKGVTIEDTALPAYMTGITVTVTSDDPSVTWSVVSTNPLEVTSPGIAGGSSITIQIAASAHPLCSSSDSFMNVATASATNSTEVSANATVTVFKNIGGPEICDGIDNNCNGLIDEGGDALCDDGEECNGAETCGGELGCLPGEESLCGNGVIDSCGSVIEECDEGAANGTPGSCCNANCTLDPPGTQCRASAGVCDLPEFCTGTSGACPPNEFQPGGTVCRPLDGACDIAETCSGSSATCPPDVIQSAGVLCRDVAGDCDVAESCSGTSAQCPEDGFAPGGTFCSESGAVCEQDAVCTGAGALCPEGEPEPDGTVCEVPGCGSGTCQAGICQVADSDGDGVCDAIDICPTVFDPDQGDFDDDGFGDACDNCPANANPDQEDTSGNGIGDICDLLKPIKVRLRGQSTAKDNSKMNMKIDFIEPGLFGTAQGVNLRIQDVLGTDVLHRWEPGDCVLAGRNILCINTGTLPKQFRARFQTLPSQPSAMRASFKMRSLTQTSTPPVSVAPPFKGPLTVTLSYEPQGGGGFLDRPGVVRDCKLGKGSIACREP